MRTRITLLLVLLILPSVVVAEDSLNDAPADLPDTPAFNDTHPTYSSDSHWTADLIVAAIGLIAAAAVIGPIVRAETPQAVPSAMSHEEDPAADRH